MNTINFKELCPVCGYALGFEAWKGDLPSDEICPCCGIQFGYFDSAPTANERAHEHDEWRKRWIALGMPWSSVAIKPPTNWNPEQQLRNRIQE